MLIKCSECELPVSDKAISCPHCGNPLQKSRIKRTNGRKRLPNGFGRITELKNPALRNRFRVTVTVGKDGLGKPIGKLLKPNAYFKTYNDAYAALVEYNKNPYDLDNIMTVNELYEKWSTSYFKTLKSQSSMRTVTSAWAYCSSVYSVNIRELNSRHIKYCMEHGEVVTNNETRSPSPNIKARIKSMFNLMLDYAMEYELIDKNCARTFNVSEEIKQEVKTTVKDHISYTDEEIELLWNNVNEVAYADVLLIQCYSGWRPQELGLIEVENVNINEWFYIGGMKTSAGTNRMVPIHSRIRPLVKKRYEEAILLNSKYLLNSEKTAKSGNSTFLSYDKYRYQFNKLVKQLGLNPAHRTHDGRKFFITKAKEYNVDEYAIKYIVGHTISDLTEKVYTERKSSWLASEIEKIK